LTCENPREEKESELEIFNIYTKDGKEFSILFDRFQLKENEFIFFNPGSQPAKNAFLSVSDVAAIVPEHQAFSDMYVPFQVYLRKRKEPIEIYALSFEIGQSEIKFYGRDLSSSDLSDLLEFPDIYVASAEVVAIFLSQGLT